MKRKLQIAVLTFAVGACQQAEVRPNSSTKSVTSSSDDTAATSNSDGEESERPACKPSGVYDYVLHWKFEKSNTYFERSSHPTYNIQHYSAGAYQPLRMKVEWYGPLCYATQPDYIKLYLHLPDGSVSYIGNFPPNTSTSTTNTIVTIPGVEQHNDLYSSYDDAAPGNYYVTMEYGISGSTDPYDRGGDTSPSLDCEKQLTE